MSDRHLLFWILSSFASVLIIFIAVPMGLNDETHPDHMMALCFGFIGFAVLIMSSFFGLWAIAIYEPNKIRIEEKPFCVPRSIEEVTNVVEDKVINSKVFQYGNMEIDMDIDNWIKYYDQQEDTL